MIQSLIVSNQSSVSEPIRKKLYDYFPQVVVGGVASSWKDMVHSFQNYKPDIIFIEKGIALSPENNLLDGKLNFFEVIILHPDSGLESTIMSNLEVGHLFNPLHSHEFIKVIHNTIRIIQWKKELLETKKMLHQLRDLVKPNGRIGIPTMDGMVFLKTKEILRCEGLHRFTKVFTINGTSIISSYNIGEFCKFLCDYSFFATHKSHLINLQHIIKYETEGSILMRDGSHVPISRRRKSQFLEYVRHI